MHRVWCLPEYVVCMETGPDHMKEFTVACRLEGLEESGAVGRSSYCDVTLHSERTGTDAS